MIRLFGLISTVVKWGVAAYIVMTGAMLLWTFYWPEPRMTDIRTADVIVCLGGGMSADGTLAAPVLTRIERCVQIYEAGHAPLVIFSGGTAAANGPSAGAQMRRYAVSIGLPDESAVTEPRAQSTLQNALFTFALTPDAEDYIIVTEGFHLPRSWASFRWAAWETDKAGNQTFQLVMSETVRRDPQSGNPSSRMLIRESLAIWFNAGRALAYSAIPRAPVDWLH